MALQLNQDFHGFTADYWVAEPFCDKQNNLTNVTMLLYKDASARQAGALPLEREQFPWPISGCYKSGAETYAAVKASHVIGGQEQNKFVNAVDC